MSDAALVLLGRGQLALTIGAVLVLALRRPVRRAFGPLAAYRLWLVAPLCGIAALLPAPGPNPSSALAPVVSLLALASMQANAAAKARESAPSLAEVLNRVTEARRRLSTASQQAEQTRQLALEANRAYQQDEVRRREQARRQANAPPVATLPAPTVRQHPTPNYAPLIDSLDVARWAVLEQVFPNW